jgi:hypothetical protein
MKDIMAVLRRQYLRPLGSARTLIEHSQDRISQRSVVRLASRRTAIMRPAFFAVSGLHEIGFELHARLLDPLLAALLSEGPHHGTVRPGRAFRLQPSNVLKDLIGDSELIRSVVFSFGLWLIDAAEGKDDRIFRNGLRFLPRGRGGFQVPRGGGFV